MILEDTTFDLTYLVSAQLQLVNSKISVSIQKEGSLQLDLPLSQCCFATVDCQCFCLCVYQLLTCSCPTCYDLLPSVTSYQFLILLLLCKVLSKQFPSVAVSILRDMC